MHYKRASDPLPFSNSIKMVFVSPVAVFAARWGGIWIRFPKERSGKVSEKAAGKVGASHPGSQTLIWHSYASRNESCNEDFGRGQRAVWIIFKLLQLPQQQTNIRPLLWKSLLARQVHEMPIKSRNP